MRNKVLSLIDRYRMISPGDHVICALSGGIDSMALLHLLLELQDTLRIRVSAAHFNHQLRGNESHRDEAFVRDICSSLQIPLQVDTGDVMAYAKENRLSTEDAARTLRYEFLLSLDPEAKIATAHNAQDNLETMLLRLIRGTGLHGLGAIPPVRGRIIRPLLTLERSELADYLSQRGILHVEDSSNAEDDYLRNRIRHQVTPLLTKENPRLAAAVSELSMELRSADAYLSERAQEALEAVSDDGAVSCSHLLALPDALRSRVLGLFLQEVPNLSRIQLQDALALAENTSPSALLQLSGGYSLRREYDFLRLLPSRESDVPPTPMLLSPGTFSFGSYTIACVEASSPETLSQSTVALTIPADGSYTIRTRQPGDRITLSGGTKKVSRYLIDQKIPAHLRDTLPVICKDKIIAAVLPVKASVEYTPETGETCYLVSAHRNIPAGMEETI